MGNAHPWKAQPLTLWGAINFPAPSPLRFVFPSVSQICPLGLSPITHCSSGLTAPLFSTPPHPPAYIISPPPCQCFLHLPNKLIALSSLLQGQHLGGPDQDSTHTAEKRLGPFSPSTAVSATPWQAAASLCAQRSSGSSLAPSWKLTLSTSIHVCVPVHPNSQYHGNVLMNPSPLLFSPLAMWNLHERGSPSWQATSAQNSRHQHSPNVLSSATNRNFTGPLSLSFLVDPSCSPSFALLCLHSSAGLALSFTTQINGPIPPIHPSPAMLASADANSSEAPPSTLSLYLGILSNQRPAVTITTCFTLSHLCSEATFQHF